MAISSSDFQNLARAVSDYSDEEYTGARKLAGTGIVGSDARISTTDEDYYGTIRYYKPLGSTLQYDGASDTTGAATVINVGTQTTDEGSKTSIKTDTERFIKTVRTHGADQYNIQRVISGEDGLGKIARDFGETQARDQDAALMSMMNAVARSEAVRGSAGGQDDPDSPNMAATRGFFIDLNDTAIQGFYNTSGSNNGQLIDTSIVGKPERIERILAASALGFSDLEADFYYLHLNPSEYLKLKATNLIDEDTITEGNVTFETILSGKYRIVSTRNVFGSQAGAAGVEATSVKTSFLSVPGAISLSNLDVPTPVEFDRDASVGRGTGNTELWYRWGYVMHPRGYNWTGDLEQFVGNAGDGTNFLYDNGAVLATNWERKADQLNLGILPIFHA